jgi:NAD(P)-dependent dehydrogenase (short-subunit alcohol dehydrogenase family)
MQKDMFSLEGKVALVTGASGAIGSEISIALADAGADIIAAGRNLDRLQNTADMVRGCGRKSVIITADISQSGEPKRVCEECYESFERVDIVINNAGTSVSKEAGGYTEGDFDLIVNTNLKGPFLLSQLFAEQMKNDKGGNIIFITSQLGKIAMHYQCLYGATKAALMQVTRSLALEWARYNIRVNSVSPGPWSKGLSEPLLQNKKVEEALNRMTPTRRLGKKGDIGGAVIFLVSNAAQHITGQDLIVDGGFSICKII